MGKRRKVNGSYRQSIEQLGLTQVAAARFLGINERTSRRYVEGAWPAPRAVKLLFAVMRQKKVSVAQAEDLIAQKGR